MGECMCSHTCAVLDTHRQLVTVPLAPAHWSPWGYALPTDPATARLHPPAWRRPHLFCAPSIHHGACTQHGINKRTLHE